MTLSWVDDSSDELGFKIERRFDIGYLPVGSVGADVTSFTESGLENCSDYTYRIYAYNQAGNSDMADPVTASTLEGEPPAVPTELGAEPQSSASVLLTWQDNSGNETGFLIEQAQADEFTVVARASADSNYFQVSGLQAGETYRFRVKCYNNCFESKASESIQVTMPSNGGFVERYVVASRDHAEENDDGSMDLHSGDLDIGRRIGGMRYRSVDIPADAAILRAYVEFQAKAFDDMETHFTMQGEYTGDADRFSGNRRNISKRTLTSAEVTWQVPAWNENSTSADFRSPDLTGIVNEMVSHPDWQPGNDMVFVVEGTGNRSAKTFDFSGDANETPRLYIEYEREDTRVVERTATPQTMQVFSNYPNPFNPSTTLVYSLDQHSKVTLAVFDASGRKVTQLIHKHQPAGSHEFTWRAAADGTPLPSGLYVARLQIENNDGRFQQSRKMLLLR